MKRQPTVQQYSEDTERVIQLLRALNTAAASLQQSVHSEEEVFRVFKELAISMNLICSLSILSDDGQNLIIRAIASPKNILSKLEKLTGMSIEGFAFDIQQSESMAYVLQTGKSTYYPHNSIIISELLPSNVRSLTQTILNFAGHLPIILAPIIIEQKIVGVMTTAGKDLSEFDIPGIEAFANHLSIAIHNSRLFTAFRRQAQELSLLDKVRTALANEIELPALIRTVVEAISETFGYTLVSLYLLEGNELILQYQVGYSTVINRILVSQGVMGRVVRTGQPVLLEDVDQDSTFLGAIQNIVSEVCVPLFDQDTVVGALNVESKGDITLGQPDLKLMVALAEHINVAFHRARLYETLQRREARLRRQRQALIVLAKNTAAAEIGMNTAFHEILQTTTQTLEVDRASVWIKDNASSNFICQGLFSLKDKPYTIGQIFAIHEFPVFLQALENDRSIAADNCCQDPRTAELCAQYYKPFNTTSVLNAPIRLNGQLVGMIAHEHVGPPRLWEDEEEVFAGSIADLIALLLEAHERHNAEEALRQVQKLESLGILAGGVAHDFNNLLVAILGQTSLALEKLPPNSTVRPHIEKATHASRRAADLTRQLLAYSGRGQFEIRPIQLNTLIEENLHLLQVGIPKNVSLNPILHNPVPPIEGDNGQLQQVIMNLIINAAESLDGHPGTVSIQTDLVEISPDNTSYSQFTGKPLTGRHYVEMRVQDTGPGIPPETLAKIFDPFFTTKDTGRGLGLAAVLGIVRGHSGGLLVKSQPGLGTTFHLLFPASDARVESPTARPPHHQNRLEGKVLIIDDEELVRQAVTDILDLENIPVITAEDGVVGLQVYRQRQHEIQAVLLDLSMPGLSGAETLRNLKSINPEVRVILTSGYSEHEVAGRFSDLGTTIFLQKPYEASRLLKMVKNLLTPQP